jgi:DNA primase
LIAKRVPLFEFAIRTELKLHNLATAEGRVNALNATAPLVAQIRDKSLRPEYSRLLAGWLGIEVEIVTSAVSQGARRSVPAAAAATSESEVDQVDQSWRPHPQEPRLLLEREVLKARLQMPDLVTTWSEIEEAAFTHPAYIEMKRVIDAHESSTIQIDEISDERMKTIFTELTVEPIRSDGEVSARYI